MKEVLILMAKYNKNANNEMMKVLEKLSPDDLQKDAGLYYGSILGTFEHILTADINFFGGIFKSYCKNPEAVCDPVFQLASFGSGLKHEAKKDLSALFETRQKTDDAMIKLVDELCDLDKAETLELPRATIKKPRYQMVMAMLTHSVHHRGQIAAVLDTLKIDNDFSGMLGI